MYNYYPSYGFDRNSQNPWQSTNSNIYANNGQEFFPEAQDDRFFLAPLVVGGLAGTALGYGIANNNQLNHMGQPCCMQPMMYYPQPMYQQPYMYSSTNSNNFYY